MELKQFAIAATQIGSIETRDDAQGWCIFFRDRASKELLPCTTRDGSTRHWKSAEVLIKQLRNAGYRGKMIISISAEQALFG